MHARTDKTDFKIPLHRNRSGITSIQRDTIFHFERIIMCEVITFSSEGHLKFQKTYFDKDGCASFLTKNHYFEYLTGHDVLKLN